MLRFHLISVRMPNIKTQIHKLGPNASNPSIWEVGPSPLVQGQPGSHSELQARKVYIVRCCLKKPKQQQNKDRINDRNKCWHEFGKRGTFILAQPLWKSVLRFLNKLNIGFCFVFQIYNMSQLPLLHIYSKGFISYYTFTCSSVLNAALFTISGKRHNLDVHQPMDG